VASEGDVSALIARVEGDLGRIDVFCSNAGVLTPDWDVQQLELTHRQRDSGINVMAHAYAAKAALPGMIARGEEYLLHASRGESPRHAPARRRQSSFLPRRPT